ncbi:hypothetical protein [Amycolatopsis xylanica]|nr:hypothetical protein [Amycolatopsis xylanica]
MTTSRIAKATLAGVFSLTIAALLPGIADATPDFAAQAQASGLTAAQATELQAKADDYLAKLGGTQIAPNKIDLDGTALISLAVPGEDHPRNLSTAAEPDPCNYYEQVVKDGHFCAYSRPTHLGDSIDMYHCQKYSLPGWSGVGSWINAQSSGTRARFYGKSGNLLYTTPVPNSFDDYNWSPVWTIRPC